ERKGDLPEREDRLMEPNVVLRPVPGVVRQIRRVDERWHKGMLEDVSGHDRMVGLIPAREAGVVEVVELEPEGQNEDPYQGNGVDPARGHRGRPDRCAL